MTLVSSARLNCLAVVKFAQRAGKPMTPSFPHRAFPSAISRDRITAVNIIAAVSIVYWYITQTDQPRMQQILLEEYERFVADMREITFLNIQSKFSDVQSSDPISKFAGQYMPILHQYQQEFDQHKKEGEVYKKIPSFDGKKEFDNTDNLHRKVISIFKAFLLSQLKDFREYLRLTIDIDQLSTLLSRIEILRFKSPEFNVIYYLFTSTKRSIRIYLKLREEIIKDSTFTPTKYHPISTYNAAKYTEKYHYLDKMTVSQKKKQWQELISLAGFEYDHEFTEIVFDYREEVPALELIEYCLWLNKATAQSNNSSPSK